MTSYATIGIEGIPYSQYRIFEGDDLQEQMLVVKMLSEVYAEAFTHTEAQALRAALRQAAQRMEDAASVWEASPAAGKSTIAVLRMWATDARAEADGFVVDDASTTYNGDTGSPRLRDDAEWERVKREES